MSWCQQVGKLFLGPGDIVNLDSGDGVRIDPASGHHNCVLELNGAGAAAKVDIKTQQIDWCTALEL